MITLGSSAGGYAAVAYGVRLQAEHVLTFSPQLNLTPHVKPTDILAKQYVDTQGSLVNCIPLLEQSSTPVFYFYGQGSQQDVKQARLVEHIPTVHRFVFNSDVHGPPMHVFDLTALLAMPTSQLQKLHQQFANRTINKHYFSIVLNGMLGYISKYSQFVWKSVRKRMKV